MHRCMVVLLCLVALVAAGCGGGGDSGISKQEYGRELSRATASLQHAFGELAKTTSKSGSTKAAGQRLTAGATALDQAADDFDRITPPKASSAAHHKLVDGLHRLADVFRKGADAARRDDARGLANALRGLSTSAGVREITAAERELQRQGVQVTTPAS